MVQRMVSSQSKMKTACGEGYCVDFFSLELRSPKDAALKGTYF